MPYWKAQPLLENNIKYANAKLMSAEMESQLWYSPPTSLTASSLCTPKYTNSGWSIGTTAPNHCVVSSKNTRTPLTLICFTRSKDLRLQNQNQKMEDIRRKSITDKDFVITASFSDCERRRRRGENQLFCERTLHATPLNWISSKSFQRQSQWRRWQLNLSIVLGMSSWCSLSEMNRCVT